MRVASALLSLLFASSAVSLAQVVPVDPNEGKCAYVEHRPELGPARDQGNLGWCYAYSSADLIQQRTGFPTSAADLAMSFLVADGPSIQRVSIPAVRAYLQAHPDFLQALRKARWDSKGKLDRVNILTENGLPDSGGDEAETILFSNMMGLCPERELPSKDDLVLRLAKDADASYDQRSREAGRAIQRPQTDFTSSILDPIAVSKADFFRHEFDLRCHRRAPPVPLIPHVVKFSDTSKEWLDGLASGRFRIEREARALLHELNRVLDSGKIAAIGYGADSIMTPDGQDDDHSSSIVARKLSGGKCYYLVRNSWGDDCSVYRPEFRPFCERGHVWVTGYTLMRTVYAVTSLE